MSNFIRCRTTGLPLAGYLGGGVCRCHDAETCDGLSEAGVDAAIEAATQANRAGDDDQAQLIAAIKAYLWASKSESEK